MSHPTLSEEQLAEIGRRRFLKFVAIPIHVLRFVRQTRDAIAECRRLGTAPFLKQWGTYRNNPYVVETGHSVQQAMKIDPPENGKGGGKLDGQLWREFPISTRKLESMTGTSFLLTASRAIRQTSEKARPTWMKTGFAPT